MANNISAGYVGVADVLAFEWEPGRENTGLRCIRVGEGTTDYRVFVVDVKDLAADSDVQSVGDRGELVVPIEAAVRIGLLDRWEEGPLWGTI